MKGINQGLALSLRLFLFTAFIVSCSSIPELKVHYELPPASEQLKGKKVFLAIEDARPTRELFAQGAQKEFENFPGSISFSIARYNEPGFKLGPYGVTAMVQEGFNRRLKNLGLEVVSEQSDEVPNLLIVLNEFLLDLVNRKWVAKMSYEARLIKGEKNLATQTISGQAERYELVGRGEANTVMGDMFTDMVNRLDLFRLFQQANLVAP